MRDKIEHVLRAASRENRKRGREINEKWKHVSKETNQYLDDPTDRGEADKQEISTEAGKSGMETSTSNGR